MDGLLAGAKSPIALRLRQAVIPPPKVDVKLNGVRHEAGGVIADSIGLQPTRERARRRFQTPMVETFLEVESTDDIPKTERIPRFGVAFPY